MYTKNLPIKQASPDAPYLSPQWIYDALMEQIEPELMSENIVKLEMKYAKESPADRTARFEGYAIAYMILNECIEELATEFQVTAYQLKNDLLAIAQSESGVTDKESIARLEKDLDSPPKI